MIHQDGSGERRPDTNEFTFDYDTYRRILRRLKLRRTFSAYDESIDDGDVLLRHDVDWSPLKAERIAEIEADIGVHATYFFLVNSPLYNALYSGTRGAIKRIAELGHDVGVHFSTHQYYNEEPTTDEVTDRVLAEKRVLETVVPDVVETVSFHIPPDWILGKQFDSFPSTYEKRFFTEIAYRGDSNQRWREDPPFADGIPEKVQILVHPGLWNETDRSFGESLERICDNRFEQTREFLEYQYIDNEVER